jgi:hypothetical protein
LMVQMAPLSLTSRSTLLPNRVSRFLFTSRI